MTRLLRELPELLPACSSVGFRSTRVSHSRQAYRHAPCVHEPLTAQQWRCYPPGSASFVFARQVALPTMIQAVVLAIVPAVVLAAIPYAPAHQEADADSDEQDDDCYEGVGDAVERADDMLPVRADRITGPGQRRGPGDAPGEGVDAEPHRRHPGDASGQRDEGAHDGQQPTEEHGLGAVPVEPAVGAVDVAGPQQDITPPAAPGRPAPVGAHAPGDVAARHVAGHARGDDQCQVQVRARDRAGGQGATEHHRYLRRHRDTRRLGDHQDEDRQVPITGDELLHLRAALLGSCWNTAATRAVPGQTDRAPGPGRLTAGVGVVRAAMDGCRSRWPARTGVLMIILGLILLPIGFLAKIAIVWTIGIVVLVVGLVFLLFGAIGRGVGGRRHYW